MNIGVHVSFLNYYRKTTYMQSTSRQMPGWMKHKLESRLLRELSITSDIQMTPPHGRKRRGTIEPVDEGGGQEWKS